MDQNTDTKRGGGGTGSIPLSGKLDGRTNVKLNPLPFEDLPEEVRRILTDRRLPENRRSPTTLEVLQGKHVLTTLIYISKMSPVMKSDVYSSISRSQGMIEKIESLYRLGLIDIYSTVSKAEILVITDKGKRVAGMVGQILDIIDS